MFIVFLISYICFTLHEGFADSVSSWKSLVLFTTFTLLIIPGSSRE